MAIVEMQKLSICADKKNRKAVLETLQTLGVMQIDNSMIDDDEMKKMDTDNAIATFEKNADILDQALRLLASYAPSTKTGGLFSERELVTRKRFEEIVSNQKNYMNVAKSILAFQKQIDENQGIIIKNRDRLHALAPWMSLDIPLNSQGTRLTGVLLGTVPGQVSAPDLYSAASKGMEDPAPVDVSVLATDSGLTYLACICLKKDLPRVEDNLRNIGFARPQQMESGEPKQIMEEITKENERLTQESEDLKKNISSLATEADEFRIASDYYRTRAEKYRLLATIPQTENVFFLEGYVPKEKAAPVKNLLEEKYRAVVDFEETTEDDVEPTLLRNNRFSETAEGVLESYGLPQHKHVDPTFVMSIFYVFFFGMMLSDAGYGIVMAVACAVLLTRKKRMEKGLQKMLRLFFWCGLSTTFWGFMYGGFFGDLIDTTATTFFGYKGDLILKPIWFAPLDNPMKLLVWCLLFGLIHLFAGLGIKGFECIQQKDWGGLLGDVIDWYLFILGLVLLLIPSDLFASMAGTSIRLPAAVSQIAKWITIIGMVMIILLGGRGKRNWAIRIALGAYDLYGVTSWLSDLLSYSRLLALGLATGVIANVINMMAAMCGGAPGIAGVICYILVLLLGHTLNIAINALGAYVHTNRLQYVEFFGKFYDAGGKAFQPFHTIHKYVQIKEGKES
ncbi:MAG: V-type ATP synthase subunit I [Bilifractor sp.]|jgi:V/A-type H+-transporting ATPase subunit I